MDIFWINDKTDWIESIDFNFAHVEDFFDDKGLAAYTIDEKSGTIDLITTKYVAFPRKEEFAFCVEPFEDHAHGVFFCFVEMLDPLMGEKCRYKFSFRKIA